MIIRFQELKQWAKDFGVSSFGMSRNDIEDLLVEAIEHRTTNLAPTMRQLKWYNFMREVEWSNDTSDEGEESEEEFTLMVCSFCEKDTNKVTIVNLSKEGLWDGQIDICNECIDLVRSKFIKENVPIGKDASKESKPRNLYSRKLRIRKR